jgi:hypothetical protein
MGRLWQSPHAQSGAGGLPHSDRPCLLRLHGPDVPQNGDVERELCHCLIDLHVPAQALKEKAMPTTSSPAASSSAVTPTSIICPMPLWRFAYGGGQHPGPESNRRTMRQHRRSPRRRIYRSCPDPVQEATNASTFSFLTRCRPGSPLTIYLVLPPDKVLAREPFGSGWAAWRRCRAAGLYRRC